MTKSLLAGLACIVALVSGEAVAGEGTFRLLQVNQSRYHASMEWIGGPIESRHITGIGIVVESSGPPFEVGSKSTSSLFVEREREGDVITALTARKTITDGDGDRLFLLVGWKDMNRSDQTIQGGTGKFAGLQGSCIYSVEFFSEDRQVIDKSCEWRR